MAEQDAAESLARRIASDLIGPMWFSHV